MGLFSDWFSTSANTSSTSQTTSSTDDADIAATDNAAVKQYRLDNAQGVTIENLDGQVALAGIASVLTMADQSVSAQQDITTQAFKLAQTTSTGEGAQLAASTLQNLAYLAGALLVGWVVVKIKGKRK